MRKEIELIDRKESVVTGERELEPIYLFENFPVFFGCVDTPIEDDITAPMSWAIDRRTGVIQLDRLIPLEVLYQEQHVDGTGPTWQRYYENFAQYILKARPKKVLEIGGGVGRLADEYLKIDTETNWTVVEPNPKREDEERLKFRTGFFDEKYLMDEEYDTIVFSQLLEHIYSPDTFIKAISEKIGDGRLVFAYPNLKLWLERKYTNALNFEHTMFLTDTFVDYLLEKNGFDIVDKIAYEDHSFFYTLEKDKNAGQMKSISVPEMYTEYKKIFEDFVEHHIDITRELNEKIDQFDGQVYLFGAHIFAQFLFQFGLDENKISGLLDNSKLKQGRRLYGSRLMVESPLSLKDRENVAVILKVGIYRDEIVKQLLEINPNIQIIE